ncbi:MAG: glycosyltransferase [Bacteroidota bacterium]
MLLLLFAVVAGLHAVYVGALILGWFRLPPPPQAAGNAEIDVVVAARNEAHRLPRLFASLQAQTLPPSAVLIADDQSEDATAECIEREHRGQPHVQRVSVPDGPGPRKKRALTAGIQAATAPLLALTDADCQPLPHWLERLAAWHDAYPGSVLVGYGPLRARSGLLNRFSRYETLVTAWLTAGAIGLGRPYMAVGRNLSYPRRLFERIGGFAHSQQSMSGDDDLLVQEVARTGIAPVRYVLDPQAAVYSEAPATWRAWLHQKRRHASAGRHYQPIAQAHLALFQATHVATWLSPLLLGWPGLGVLAGLSLLRWGALGYAAHRLQESVSLGWIPVLDTLYALYNLTVVPVGLLSPPKAWSHRQNSRPAG